MDVFGEEFRADSRELNFILVLCGGSNVMIMIPFLIQMVMFMLMLMLMLRLILKHFFVNSKIWEYRFGGKNT